MENSFTLIICMMLTILAAGGFAAMETGFSRAKNAGNTMIKCLAGCSIAAVAYLMIGQWIAAPGNPVAVLTQALGCAVVICIFSGALVGRIKFSAYCVSCLFLSTLLYPAAMLGVRLFTSQAGLHDFAGLGCVSVLGAGASLAGAKILGPRIGKYTKGGVSKAMPGHNIPLSLLGVLLVGACGFGTVGAVALCAGGDVVAVAGLLQRLLLTAGLAVIAAFFLTWLRYQKPDTTMTAHGLLAGIVAGSVGCDVMPLAGSILTGLLAGTLSVIAIETVDRALHIDDPSGSCAIFGVGGIVGLLTTGLFSRMGGVFTGTGFQLLGAQALAASGLFAIAALPMGLLLFVLKKTMGLRFAPELEIEGLDLAEHGLLHAYNDFAENLDTADWNDSFFQDVNNGDREEIPLRLPYDYPGSTGTGLAGCLVKIEIITRKEKFEQLKVALNDIGITGMTVFPVSGYGVQRGYSEFYRGIPMEVQLRAKVRVEIVVAKVPVADVVNTARRVLYTGRVGDGKIFITPLRDVVRVRTGESGYDAMQGAASE